MDYQEYLKSGQWKTIRAQRLAMDNGECVLCGEKAENVHHRRYPKALGTETVRDLVSLCRGCHEKHHENARPPTGTTNVDRLPGMKYGRGMQDVTSDGIHGTVLCPICGFEYVRWGKPEIFEANDEHSVQVCGNIFNGSVLRTPMMCERGCNWYDCMGLHKGYTFYWVFELSGMSEAEKMAWRGACR